MQLTLKRVVFEPGYTLGNLFVDGKHFCFTCEDVVRADGVKVMHETAIPHGTYEIKITHSQRFGKDMPELMNVPMFTGIRIHAGNSAADTSGCILVGYGVNTQGSRNLTDSGNAYAALFDRMQKAIENHECIGITIINEAFE